MSLLVDVGVPIVTALLGAGVFNYLREAWKLLQARRENSTEQAIEKRRIHDAVAAANDSVVVAVTSNKMLQEDNARLRREIAEKDVRHDQERAAWEVRERELKAELDAIEEKWRRALDELVAFKMRNGLAGPVPGEGK